MNRVFEDKLKEDIYLLDENTAVFKHDGVLVEEEFELMFQKVYNVTSHLDRFYYIIDLKNSKEVTAQQRRYLMRKLKTISSKFIHVSIVSGQSTLRNLLAKFVFGGIGFKSVKFHKTFEEAKKDVFQQKNK